MNVDRYINDEAQRLAWESYIRKEHPVDGLRAALPAILVAHRADVLREVLSFGDNLDPESIDLLQQVVFRMSVPAVADGR